MPAYQAPQIDSSSSIDSNLSNEAERRGWNKTSYNRKNQEPVNFYDFTRKNLNFEIKRGEPIKDKDGKAVRDKAGRIIFNRPSIIPLGSQPLSLKERYEKRLDEIGYKPWQNANNNQPNTNVRIVLSGDHDRMSEIAFGKPTDFEKGTDNSHAQLVKIEPDKLREMAERYGVLDLIDTEQEYSQIALYALCFYKFLCNKFGEENVIGLCCHLDETTPHFHAWIVPVAEKMKSGRTGGYTLVGEDREPVLDENGNEIHITTRAYERMPEEKKANYVKTTASKKMGLSYASYFGKSRSEAVTSYEKYHDMIHEEVTKKWGFARGVILRNLSPDERAKHGRKSKKQLERERLLEEKKLQEVMEKTTKAERNLMEMEIKKEKLAKENKNLAEKNAKMDEEITRKDQVLKSMDKEIDEKESKLDDLDNELNTNDYLIQEQEEKIDSLSGQIRESQEEFTQVLNATSSKKAELKEVEKQLSQKTVHHLAKETLINHCDNIYSSIKDEAITFLNYFMKNYTSDKRWFRAESISENLTSLPSFSEDIIDDAVALFLADSNIGNSTGGGRWDRPQGMNTAGGIGTEGSSIKRKPDEDDNAFMYRCVVMACMKVKKSKGIKSGR